jgi:hypothetical protein
MFYKRKQIAIHSSRDGEMFLIHCIDMPEEGSPRSLIIWNDLIFAVERLKAEMCERQRKAPVSWVRFCSAVI